MSAATSGKAADEMSPGMLTAQPVNSGWPTMVMVRPPPSLSETVTSAPKWPSIRSV